MPAEVRSIIFSRAELVEGVTLYFKKLGDPLPSGSVKSFSFESQPLVVTLDFVSDRDQRKRDIRLEAETLTAVVLAICRDKRVPIPVSAQKKLHPFGDCLCLTISRNIPDANLKAVSRLIHEAL